jgi:hypothetical protein
LAVADFLSVAGSLAKFATAMVAMAGQAPHLTAVANAQTALADARRRAEERREVAVLFATAASTTRGPQGAVTAGERHPGR